MNYTEVLPKELLTKKEIARRLRISVRKIETTDFPRYKFGRTVRYSWPEVLSYVKEESSKLALG